MINTLKSRPVETRQALSSKLSAREVQIVRLLLSGKKNSEIASALSLSEQAVKGYVSDLMVKFHARSRLEVVLAAQKLNAIASETKDLAT